MVFWPPKPLPRGLVGLLHSQLPSPETASSFPSGTNSQVDTATHPFEGLLGCLPQPFTVDDCWTLCSPRCAWLCPPCGPAGRSTTWSRRWQRARRLWGWTKTRWRRSATLWNIGFLRRWRQHFCRGKRQTPWPLSCPAGIESCFGKRLIERIIGNWVPQAPESGARSERDRSTMLNLR